MKSPVEKHKAFERAVDESLNHIKIECHNVEPVLVQKGIGNAMQNAIDAVIANSSPKGSAESRFQGSLNELGLTSAQQTGFKGIFEATKTFLGDEVGLIKKVEHIESKENLGDSTILEMSASAQQIIKEKTRHALNIEVGPSLMRAMEDSLKTTIALVTKSMAPFLKKKS